jgi:PPP family 3-phenylpropionic acid transporter
MVSLEALPYQNLSSSPLRAWFLFARLFCLFYVKDVIVKPVIDSFFQAGSMNRVTVKSLTLHIALIQGFYWMIFCPISSYASVYLLHKDFSNQQIGWVLALNGILAVFLQPWLGALADRSRHLPLKGFIAILAFFPILMLIALNYLPLNWLWISLFYVLTLAFMQTLQPLINSLTFQCINAGYEVSYGFTRAIGSLTFAILSSLIGLWLNSHTPDHLPLFGAILFVAVFLLILFFPNLQPLRKPDTLAQPLAPAGMKESTTDFLKKYQGFLMLILGVAFLFVFHNIINSYLVQIMTPLGAQDFQLGLALTIAALCELPALFGFNFLVRRVKAQTLLQLAGIFYALRSLLFFFAASIWMINLGQVIQGVTYALIIPASVYYVDHLMKDEDKVKGQTWITGGMTLGGIIGSIVGGWMLDRFSVHALLGFGMAAAVLGSLLIVWAIRRSRLRSAPLMAE